MSYLVIAVLCSVAVSALLKVLRRHDIDIRQTIAAGYPVALLLTWVLLKPDLNMLNHSGAAWSAILMLSILLPLVFVILARAIELAGIVATDAAQRISLIIPIAAAFTIFGETVTPNVLVGVLLGFLALVALVYRTPEQSPNYPEYRVARTDRSNLKLASFAQLPAGFWLLLVWLGYGFIDILFKIVAKQGAAFPLTLWMVFALAGLFLFVYLVLSKVQWQSKALAAGLILGALNMGNIYAYIKAHQAMSDSPSVVFTGMNVGVIALATLVGLFAFKETLSKLNLLGVMLAVGCVLVLFSG